MVGFCAYIYMMMPVIAVAACGLAAIGERMTEK